MGIIGYEDSYKNLILPCAELFCLKNKNLETVAISEELLPKLGLKKSEDILGFTDYDMKCPSLIHADRFRTQDRRALLSPKPIIHLEIMHYCGKIDTLISVKMGINSESVALNVFHLPLNKYSLLKIESIRESILSKKYTNWKNYEVLESFPMLTKKESMILFYLIRGRSANETGALLHRSKRTIEDHIRNMKAKLVCKSLGDLIEYTLCFSYDNYVPLSFITRK